MAKKPVIQVALDALNLHRAMQIAKEAVLGGADWLEAGTPLIKSEGVESIRQLKKQFPNHVLVADMKTMDVGATEVEMASKAGADIICIMGVAGNSTITEAVKAAGKIHSDMERGFIRAEVISYDDLEKCGSLAEARSKGLLRREGKSYIVKDGDVITFLFNV